MNVEINYDSINSLMPPSFRYAGTFRERSYPHWKLEDISVYFDRREIADTTMMEIFAHSVPAIKSFCGREVYKSIFSREKQNADVRMNLITDWTSR
jgi:hypothetical protein